MHKYRALHMVSTLLQVVAWGLLLLGLMATILCVIVAALGAGRLGNLHNQIPLSVFAWMLGASALRTLLLAVSIGLASSLQFLFLLAISDLLRVLIDIEENTRSTAYYIGPKL